MSGSSSSQVLLCGDASPVVRDASALLDAAEHLKETFAASDVLDDDLGSTISLVARALGELAEAGELLETHVSREAGVAPGARPARRGRDNLRLRLHELVSALCLARRDAELVGRQLSSPAPLGR
jgi:hypothetical protein